MELEWGEADPQHLLGDIVGCCVRLNDGPDVTVRALRREGMVVVDWSEDGEPIAGSERMTAWDDVQRLYVY